MKKRYSKVIRTYFSDYVIWLIGVSFLFISTLIVFNRTNKFIWLIPVLFLVIYLLSIRLLTLYFRARKDLKADNIEKLTIQIATIQYDNYFNFKSKGGGMVGAIKYRIVDENHNIYLLSASKTKDNLLFFHPHPTFSLEILVLKKSRLVLSMKIIENTKTTIEARKQQRNIKRFKEVFCHYF